MIGGGRVVDRARRTPTQKLTEDKWDASKGQGLANQYLQAPERD